MEPRPLLVLPMPADARLFTAVTLAFCDWWKDRYGEELMTSELSTEETPYGQALVLRERQVVAPAGLVSAEPADSPREGDQGHGGDR